MKMYIFEKGVVAGEMDAAALKEKEREFGKLKRMQWDGRWYQPEEENGFFYCPVCSCKSAVWQNDFDAEDAGCDRPGIVTYYSCANCGAEIEATRLEELDDLYKAHDDGYNQDSANPYDMKIKEALEKQIPKKVADDRMRIPFSYYCPNCYVELTDDGYKDTYTKYCYDCGQRIKWD